MTPLLRKLLGINWLLFLPMIGLMAYGVMAVYSAVHFRQDSLAFLSDKWREQMQFALWGLIPFFIAALINYRWVKWGALPLYLLGIGLMVLLLMSKGDVHGQKIALTIANKSFQPAQVAISSAVILLALILAEGQNILPILRYQFLRLLLACIVFAIPFGLILLTKDIGSALVMIPVFYVMLLTANIPFRYLISIFLLGAALAPIVYFVALKPYQQERINVTYKVLAKKPVNELDEAYALNHILTAIATAGVEGKGYDLDSVPEDNASLTHLGLIPSKTSHNDFIFTVIAETFGFGGAALLILAFLYLFAMAMTIAMFACDSLGRLLAAGIIGQLFAHTFEHIGMNLGIVPITGIPLPLVSYGGTFLLIVLALLGLMQSVWVHRNKMLEPTDAKSPNRPTRNTVSLAT